MIQPILTQRNLKKLYQTNFQVIAETQITLKNPSTAILIACEDYIEHADKWSVSRWNSLYEEINAVITEVTANFAQATLWCINIFI